MPWNSADPAMPRRWLQRGAVGLGWLLALLGTSGFGARLFGLNWWLEPLVTFPALSPVESLAILVAGFGIVEAAAGRNRATIGAGLILVGLATFSFRGHLSTALLIGISGTGLVGLGLPARVDRGRLIAGMHGAIAIVFSLGILTTRSLWHADVEGGLLVDSSLQLLLAVFLLGLVLTAASWAKNPAIIDAPWVPLAVGLASMLVVGLLWRAFVDFEREAVREQTRGAVRNAAHQLERQIESASRTLTRIARFSTNPWPRSREGENRAVALSRDVDGLIGLAWTGPAGVSQVQPEGIDSVSLRADLGARLRAVAQEATPGSSRLPLYFPLSDPVRFAIAVPLCDSGVCVGHVVGVFDANQLMTPVLTDTASGYLFAATAERRAVIAPPGRLAVPRDWSEPLPFHLGDLRWDISAWPSVATMQRFRSGLPDLLLLAGLLCSTLLPLTIRLSQLTLTRARLAERVRLKEALETATDGIWEWDVATGAARRSAALWRHLGYDPDVMSRKPDPWPWLVHSGDQWRVMRGLAEHLSGQTPTYEARYRIRSLDGDWHWMIDRGRVVEWSTTGQPLRVLGISADVTERLRADDELAASERRFRAIFESAGQIQILLDEKGRVLEANRAAVTFSGLVLSAMRGRRLWTLPCWRGETGQVGRVAELVVAAQTGKQAQEELELQAPGGEPLLVDLSISPILDGNGKVSQLLVDARDITLRHRAEEMVREVESLTTMGRIASRVAHEINNPLAGIQNAFLLIKDAVPPDHPHYAYVGAVEREVRRIAAVTRQLYETYRPEGDGVLDTSLTSLVGDAVALLEQVNRGSGVRIEVDLHRAPSTVPLPEAILRQALYNLVQNAIEASPPGGAVEVSAASEGGMFTLAVGDRGEGIPEQIRERVFEPFFTTKTSAVRTGGMGIGLSLVARSAQALGGQVEIHDRAGGGTLALVRLPMPANSGASA